MFFFLLYTEQEHNLFKLFFFFSEALSEAVLKK